MRFCIIILLLALLSYAILVVITHVQALTIYRSIRMNVQAIGSISESRLLLSIDDPSIYGTIFHYHLLLTLSLLYLVLSLALVSLVIMVKHHKEKSVLINLVMYLLLFSRIIVPQYLFYPYTQGYDNPRPELTLIEKVVSNSININLYTLRHSVAYFNWPGSWLMYGIFHSITSMKFPLSTSILLSALWLLILNTLLVFSNTTVKRRYYRNISKLVFVLALALYPYTLKLQYAAGFYAVALFMLCIHEFTHLLRNGSFRIANIVIFTLLNVSIIISHPFTTFWALIFYFSSFLLVILISRTIAITSNKHNKLRTLVLSLVVILALTLLYYTYFILSAKSLVYAIQDLVIKLSEVNVLDVTTSVRPVPISPWMFTRTSYLIIYHGRYLLYALFIGSIAFYVVKDMILRKLSVLSILAMALFITLISSIIINYLLGYGGYERLLKVLFFVSPIYIAASFSQKVYYTMNRIKLKNLKVTSRIYLHIIILIMIYMSLCTLSVFANYLPQGSLGTIASNEEVYICDKVNTLMDQDYYLSIHIPHIYHSSSFDESLIKGKHLFYIHVKIFRGQEHASLPERWIRYIEYVVLKNDKALYILTKSFIIDFMYYTSEYPNYGYIIIRKNLALNSNDLIVIT